jgi:hypothetical protein
MNGCKAGQAPACDECTEVKTWHNVEARLKLYVRLIPELSSLPTSVYLALLTWKQGVNGDHSARRPLGGKHDGQSRHSTEDQACS